MSYNFSQLEPLIHQILSAPGTDLTTISAKRVRRGILSLDSSLTPEFVKDNKDAIDQVITRVFEQFSESNGAGDEEGDEAEDQQTAYDDQTNDEEEEEEKASTKPRKMNKDEKADAELARKLSSEINGRARRTAGKGGSRSANGSAKKGRSRKSAATVDSDDDGSVEGGKKTKTRRKANTEGGAKGGFAKEYNLSAPLATLLQVDKLSRPQVVKQLWVYIKEKNLQNPENKREILCDDNMRAVFNTEKIDMFKMNKVLGQHLHENGE